MILRTTGYASVLALTILICGCDNGSQEIQKPVMNDDSAHDDHDHGHADGDHPETLGEALHELTELRDTVRDAFAKKDSEAAHGPLHDVGHLIGEVSELAQKAGLSDEANATIKTSTETLMDSFGAVDKKMHNADEGADYSEVSDKIDAALAAIVEAAGPAGEYHGDHDHDGEHADHKEGHDEKDGDHDHKDADHGHKEGDKKE